MVSSKVLLCLPTGFVRPVITGWAYSTKRSLGRAPKLCGGPAPMRANNISIQTLVGEEFWRGVAKVGFHYFLSQHEEYSGHENLFQPIRNFIGDSSPSLPFARVNDFVSRYELRYVWVEKLGPADVLYHQISTQIYPGVCIASMQFLLTKQSYAPLYTVILAKDQSLVAGSRSSHTFEYYRPSKPGRQVGEAKLISSLPAIR